MTESSANVFVSQNGISVTTPLTFQGAQLFLSRQKNFFSQPFHEMLFVQRFSSGIVIFRREFSEKSRKVKEKLFPAQTATQIFKKSNIKP